MRKPENRKPAPGRSAGKDRKSFIKKPSDRKPAERGEKSPTRRTDDTGKKPFARSADSRGRSKREEPRSRGTAGRTKPGERPTRGAGKTESSSTPRPFERFRKKESRRPDTTEPRARKERPGAGDRDFRGKSRERSEDSAPRRVKYQEFEEGRAFAQQAARGDKKPRRTGKKAAPAVKTSDDGLIRLNKYLSNAGVASRREADTLIQSGAVKVNGEVITQLGHKIHPNDRVTYGDAAIRSERKVYLLLNKPKDYITTVDDPQERKTVMELIAKACKERVYPVGRLDRNTTGLLLFTNDGELTRKLTHPKYGIKKVYHVSLNKGLKPDDFKAIAEGLELEDGLIKADDIAFVGEGKKEIGIEIHSGRNRLVRRIFEHLGYDVLKLDRVVFAGLTKKDLPRGKYRFLTAKEVGFLQMIG